MKSNWMMIAALVLGAAAGAALSQWNATATAQSAGAIVAPPQAVVVHLSRSTNDWHAASMALKLGAGMAQRGATVVLMLDLEGVRLVDASLPEDLNWGGGPTIAKLYDGFIAAGGKAVVCPHCAHAAGLTPDHLRTGASIAGEGDLAKLLLGADKILDY
jgi:predicted peroxiredoxin